MDEKKLVELMKDDIFVEKMLEATTEEEVKALFKDKGMELNDGDIEFLAKAIAKAAEKDGRLSEEDLKGIAGGVDASGVAVGASIGVGVASIAAVVGSIYSYLKGKKDAKKDAEEWGNIIKGRTTTFSNTSTSTTIRK